MASVATFNGEEYKQLLRNSGLMKLYAEMKNQAPAGELEIDLADFTDNAGKVFLPGGKKGLEFLKHFVKEEGMLLPGRNIAYDGAEYDPAMVIELLHFLGYAEKSSVLDKMIRTGRLVEIANRNVALPTGRFGNNRGPPVAESPESNWSPRTADSNNSNLEEFNLSRAHLRTIKAAQRRSPTKKGRAERRRKGKTRKGHRGKKRHSPSSSSH